MISNTEHWIRSPKILKYCNEILLYNMFPSDVGQCIFKLKAGNT